MARVNYVTKARTSKNKRVCAIGGETIEPGESYKYVDLKTGPVSGFTRYFCFRHQPRASHTTANARLSTLYACRESLEDALEMFNNGLISLDDLKAEVESQADEIESVADEYEESKNNMPENLQYGSVAEELEQKASDVREWADSLRDYDFPEDDAECTYGDVEPCRQSRDHDVHQQGSDDYEHDFEGDSVDLSELEGLIGNCPL